MVGRPDKREGRPGAATSYDVARAAGVSQSAVSRCFKPGASVAPATRARILAAARALGYQPNAIARGLITRRSNLVAVLISNLTNLYYPEVLAELTRRLGHRGARVLLFALAAESEVDAALDQVWRYRVDGIIAAARLTPDQVDAVDTRGIPLVLYNRIGEGAAVSSVCCDSVAGENELVGRLLAAGHRCFGIVSGPDDSYVSRERVAAAAACIRAAGLEPVIVPGAFDYASGADGLRQLMAETGGALDALVAANDLMAVGAMDAARDVFGLDVPGRLSIVGFDGVGPAGWASYRLTTVRQPVRRMTEAAVQMLMERIEEPGLPAERRLFAGELLRGCSARLPADSPQGRRAT
jgi:DNA-binding LacI/PurR family transcriptional regulator